ncbi:hypothetical protein NMG60_11023109 [Bertholletia excelsa]
MGSEAPPSRLPLVDFTKESLKPGTSSWVAAGKRVREFLEEYGCFLATYEEVSSELKSEVLHVAEVMFDLPAETKTLNTSHIPYYGYYQSHLAEGLGVGNATNLEGIQSFADTIWPAGNDRFCETMLSYSRVVSELERTVKRMVFESYGVEKLFASHAESTTYLLRLNKYRPAQKDENNEGAPVHTDKSMITILDQNQVGGLEVRAKDGEWISVQFSPSSFLVMAGDAFLAWSNGRIHSAFHRVVMRGNKPRYSVAMFSFHVGTIDIPQELVDDHHPLQFKSFDHFGLLRFFAANISRIAESSARAYCGL